MNKKIQTLKGFRDFSAKKMVIRNEIIKRLRSVFEKYGFDELQTPSLEYQEILLGKYGEEAEKLMYLFQDPGGRNVGLRYDLTVPLARFVGNNVDLPIPFKRYQIQPVWRADKPQKGRYREFYQCDVDTVGSNSPTADAEILAIISDCLRALDFQSFKIRVNSRQVLFSIMEKAGIKNEMYFSVIQSIDKLDKKTPIEVEDELATKGISESAIKEIFEILKQVKPDAILSQVCDQAVRMGAKNLVFDPTLARGLDYYTGPIFESVVEEPKIGSLTGGGRYDNLLKNLGGFDYPATGTTLGLDRIADVIDELNLWPNLPDTQTMVLVCVLSSDIFEKSLDIVSNLRNNGVNCEIALESDKKIGGQLKYADQKGIPYAIIIGPDEIKSNKLVLKNLATRQQKIASLAEIVQQLIAS
ncbi:histidine--tRNA ligase [Candidatus Woesebacteria bacterium RIFOXYB1_FULL_38_16]|uniref:Histidine--tRNA ligase n=1 Tax=Candidatus Woesebacteria bacterium RIFOXYB1_FULL_38_16 TaxID=1802538 RepID=A0A1F8CSF4_9BACT|nr:MAG: histidine--tRNA ligase [Candidatus Woesebacteria bacterium RIFOXYA1_FULL_38_9]OGM78769.1 MAG: histidine--tRNA ligase [Candidatus Woesebacteria bacterium RIFOXYB1_FULL_38_16]